MDFNWMEWTFIAICAFFSATMLFLAILPDFDCEMLVKCDIYQV